MLPPPAEAGAIRWLSLMNVGWICCWFIYVAKQRVRFVQYFCVRGQCAPGAGTGHHSSFARSIRARACGPLQRWRGECRADGERTRPRCFHRAAHVSAGERQFDGIVDDDGCLQARVREAGHRGRAVLRIRPPGSAAACNARGHRRQAGGEHDRDGRSRPPADGGFACGSDPRVFRHTGGQRVCLAGAAGRRLEAQGCPDDRGVAGRRRRGARPRRSPSAWTMRSWPLSTSAGRGRTSRR